MLKHIRNLNKFQVMSVLTSALYFYLFISCLLFPESLCKDFGVMGNESVYFLARRTSTLMLGFAVLLFMVRNSASSELRQAIAFSVGLNMAGFALLGTFELNRGFVKVAILGAIVIEVLVAAIYFSFWASDRRQAKKADS